MVNAQHFITVLTLLSLSIATLPPAHGSIHDQSTRRDQGTNKQRSILPKPKKRLGVASANAHALRRGPTLQVDGVVELDVHSSFSSSSSQVNKRGVINGTQVNLGTSQNTFVVPVSIGSPPSTYPLQLDLASSDLLVASTLCSTSSCPASLGPNVNAYYDVSKGSSGFQEVNDNQTYWNTSYADGTVASGIIARETVTLGEVMLQGQIMGFINSTNLTLSQQKISGILGLGFPRLSSLSHIFLEEAQNTSTTPTSNSTSSISSSSFSPASISASSSSVAASAQASSPTYLPPLLENLVRTPHLPYPVFALALAPPPTSNATSTSTASSIAASSTGTARYQSKIGSLTLGGISNSYVSNKTGSGRTIDDIEWHDIVPFGRARSFSNDSSGALSRTTSTTSSSLASETASTSASNSQRRRRSDESQIDELPTTLDELSEEEYLFWALELHNLSLNGTDIPLNSSYSDIGLPSIALLDAGFNGIYGPQQDVIELFDKITDARLVAEGRWVVPCNTKMTIGFSFGGRYIQLQPSDWISAQIDQSSFCLAWPMAAASTGDGIDWQLGTPFLKKVYSIFSYGINGVQAPLVGFLPLEDISTGTSNSTSSSTSSSGVTTSSTNPNSPIPTTIEDLSLTATVTTLLPNAILPDPTYTTPTYVYSASPTLLQPGITQFMGLANSSAYSVEQVPVISLDSAATSRIASMAGGESGGGTAATGGSTSSGMRISSNLIGTMVGLAIGFIGIFNGLNMDMSI
ncbi:uncharacterized protein IL334_007051 [Kwoniella shivajii]|uniref:Peptidase A1 domain-containing protein n=1 Tax=Kwoniella shivajii TaxID=564305 RepID=A0ABZ1D7N1_9TREE|nr:hypothetical protein IL334_007051 [Kwoniella shivajii]